MTKPVIKNHDDLMAEKQRLKRNVQKSRQQVRDSFEELKDELNPFSNLKEAAQQVFHADKTSPFVRLGINKAADLLLNKFLLKKVGWPLKLIIPLVVKELAGRLISDKPDKKIAAVLHQLAAGLRTRPRPKSANRSSR